MHLLVRVTVRRDRLGKDQDSRLRIANTLLRMLGLQLMGTHRDKVMFLEGRQVEEEAENRA